MGGGSVMVWGAFGYNGITDLAFITTRMNSQNSKHQLKCDFFQCPDEFETHLIFSKSLVFGFAIFNQRRTFLNVIEYSERSLDMTPSGPGQSVLPTECPALWVTSYRRDTSQQKFK
uniref:Uncharacterized protein n=1 Tax=Strigamia maritima TaxID=126957 RepID=T1J8M2_STRMM